MTRPSIELFTRGENRAAADASDDLGVEECVIPVNLEAPANETVSGQLEARSASLADVRILARESHRIEGPQTDQIVEMICEVRCLYADAIVRKPLLNRNVEAS